MRAQTTRNTQIGEAEQTQGLDVANLPTEPSPSINLYPRDITLPTNYAPVPFSGTPSASWFSATDLYERITSHKHWQDELDKPTGEILDNFWLLISTEEIFKELSMDVRTIIGMAQGVARLCEQRTINKSNSKYILRKVIKKLDGLMRGLLQSNRYYHSQQDRADALAEWGLVYFYANKNFSDAIQQYRKLVREHNISSPTSKLIYAALESFSGVEPIALDYTIPFYVHTVIDEQLRENIDAVYKEQNRVIIRVQDQIKKMMGEEWWDNISRQQRPLIRISYETMYYKLVPDFYFENIEKFPASQHNIIIQAILHCLEKVKGSNFFKSESIDELTYSVIFKSMRFKSFNGKVLAELGKTILSFNSDDKYERALTQLLSTNNQPLIESTLNALGDNPARIIISLSVLKKHGRTQDFLNTYKAALGKINLNTID
ncbi:MAG: hypothetical protein ACHP9Y_03440, partial [Gammaproteobacteria bacterium]